MRAKTGQLSDYPVITDKEGVIIIGHEKYFAYKQMGLNIDHKIYDIPEEVAYKYRLVDCRVSAQSSNVRMKPFYQELFNNHKEYVKAITKSKSKTKKAKRTKTKSKSKGKS